MSFRVFSRLLPALGVVTLFVLVAATPSPDPAPQMPVNQPAPCADYSQTSGGASTVSFVNGDGVTQPFSSNSVLLACSLHVAATGWNYANLYIREWDPLTLAPEPSTIATRTAYLDPSRMSYYTRNTVGWTLFSPPIIHASIPGVAEPPSTMSAMELRSTVNGYGYSLNGYYEPAGDADLGQAQFVSANGSQQPLQGVHPVLGHAACSGGEQLQDLKIVQSVKRTDAPLTEHPYEMVQLFRVPLPVELRWVELAVNGTPAGVANVGEEMPVPPSATVAILETTGPNTPPVTLPPSLVEALFESPWGFSAYSYMPAPRWASHVPFDYAVMLYPGHDYWLQVRGANPYEFNGRALTGDESTAFTSGVGGLFTRNIDGGEWSSDPNRVLSFKLVGVATATLGVSPPRPADPFRLSVSPNPASGLPRVEWSGAVGPVKLEVFDARGRRVARGEGGAAGAWSLATTGRDARALPAGVYFVHARDSAGQLMVERAVIVR